MTATQTEKVIGLWLDYDTDSDEPSWIVSRDQMNANGQAVTTTTVSVCHEDDYEKAFEEAVRLARKDGLCVIETDEDGEQFVMYAPKVITISDGIGHSKATYRLYDDALHMVSSGGCEDALNANGCKVSEDMADDDIIKEVYESWTGDGYEGDPDENGLVVIVETEKSIID